MADDIGLWLEERGEAEVSNVRFGSIATESGATCTVRCQG